MSDDYITGTGGRDLIYSGGGDDTIDAGDGNDIIISGRGDDTIYGGAGDDLIISGSGDDVVYGGDGDDVIITGSGDDTVDGGAGDDYINTGSGDDIVDGGAGDDVIIAGSGDDTIDGSEGNDFICAGSGNDTVYGSAGHDLIFSGSGNDFVQGGEGNDVIVSASGDDIVEGGEGEDIIIAGSGDDIASGGAGNDIVFGNAGMDVLSGDAGDDLVVGGVGSDVIEGGEDNGIFTISELNEISYIGGDHLWGGRERWWDCDSFSDDTDSHSGDTDHDTFVYDFNGGLDIIHDFSCLYDTLKVNYYRLEDIELIDTQKGLFIKFDDQNGILLKGVSMAEFMSSPECNIEFFNSRPISEDVTATGDEDTVIPITLIASDNDGNALDGIESFTVQSLPSDGILYKDAGLTDLVILGEAIASTGETLTLYFEPTLDFNGDVSFSYTANDGLYDSDISSATITVIPDTENEPPVAGDDYFATTEDMPITMTEAELLANDTDPDSDPLSVLEGDITYDPTAEFNYLAEGETVVKELSYTVSDGQGGEDTGSIFITITGVNDAPTLIAGVGAAEEDGPSIIVELASLGADVDSDDDGASLSYSIVSGPGEGTANIVGTTLTFAPGSDFQDLALGETKGVVVRVQAMDQHGAAVENDVIITVTGTNDAPTLIAGVGAAEEDGPSIIVELASLGADVDSDDDGASLSYSIVSGPDVGEGTANIVGTTLTFVPGLDFQDLALGEPREVIVRVQAMDQHGAAVENDVIITVTGANDAPMSANNTVITEEDVSHVFVLSEFNFSDIDNGDELAQIQITSLESVGALKLNGVDVALDQVITSADIEAGLLTFTPLADENGAGYDSFDFKVHDGIEYSASAYTMTIDVNAVNNVPIAEDDSIATDEDTIISGNVLLDNGNGEDVDIDGDPLTVVAVNGSTSGIGSQITLASGAFLTLNADGTFDYDPNGQFEHLGTSLPSATDTFEYTISDGNGGEDTATVTLSIDGINDAPVANPDIISVANSAYYTYIFVLSNDIDPEGDEMSITGLFPVDPIGGKGIIEYTNMSSSYSYVQYYPNGEFDYLAPGEIESVTYNYIVSDSYGEPGVGALQINIYGTPVILDLDSDGIELISVEESTVAFDIDGSGIEHTMGWVSGDDALLVYDVNGDGIVNGVEEFMFANYHEDANTDLEGLALAFDTNLDGIFDAKDEAYIDFGIWQDINEDGITDEGEFTTLADADIAAINLVSDGDVHYIEGNIVYGLTEYVTGNGEIGIAGDVGLTIAPDVEEVEFSLDAIDVLTDLPGLLDSLLGETESASVPVAEVVEVEACAPCMGIDSIADAIDTIQQEVVDLS